MTASSERRWSIDWDRRLMRTVLFVPGSDSRKLAKAETVGADVVVFDLEDAVAESKKAEARDLTRAAIRPAAARGPVAVRVNGLDSGRMEEDIAAVAVPGLDAIVVPKVEDPDALAAADRALALAERAQRLSPGSVGLIAIVETALGVVRCEDILLAAPRRTVTTMFGLADFATALGVDVTPEGRELFYARSRLIVATRAAGLVAPLDGPYLDVEDDDGLLRDSRRSRQLGFQGRLALHPRQIEPIQRAFSELSEVELAAARRIVAAFQEAEGGGRASIRVDGRFVDYPLYNRAREKLLRHDAYMRAARR
jgi:citrate lyase subunit beta/citryl-CoA lyase